MADLRKLRDLFDKKAKEYNSKKGNLEKFRYRQYDTITRKLDRIIADNRDGIVTPATLSTLKQDLATIQKDDLMKQHIHFNYLQQNLFHIDTTLEKLIVNLQNTLNQCYKEPAARNEERRGYK